MAANIAPWLKRTTRGITIITITTTMANTIMMNMNMSTAMMIMITIRCRVGTLFVPTKRAQHTTYFFK